MVDRRHGQGASAGTTTSGATPTGSSTWSTLRRLDAVAPMPMRTLDDLLDVTSGRRVLVRADLNVPLATGRHARSPTTAGSGPASPTIQALRDRGRPRGGRAPTSAGPRASRTRSYSPARRWPTGSASCSAGRSRSPTDVVGDVGAAPRSPALADGDVALLENLRFDAGRDQQGRRRARGVRRPAGRRWPTCFVSDGFGVVHRKQASVYDVAAAAAARRRRSGARRGRGAARSSPSDPHAPVRRRARRLQGLRQARRHRQPARPGRPAAHRRRHGASRSWPRRATRSATRCSRRTSSTTCRGLLAQAAASRRRDRAAQSTSSSPRAFAADADDRGRRRPTRSRPTGMGLDIGPRVGERVRRPRSPTPATVFWNGPMGVFEFAAVRGGHPRASPRR